MIIFKVCVICFVSFFQSLKIIEGLSQSHLGFFCCCSDEGNVSYE